MFTGEHQHTLDGKGRVILPARFRDALADGLFFTPGQDHCIDVWPAQAFHRRVEELRSLPREDARFRAYLRTLLAGAHEQVPDAQGRVVIPARLREYAHLDRDLSVNGMDERIQIWSRRDWDSYRQRHEESFASLDLPFSL